MTILSKPVHVSKHLFNWFAIKYFDVTQHSILFSYCWFSYYWHVNVPYGPDGVTGVRQLQLEKLFQSINSGSHTDWTLYCISYQNHTEMNSNPSCHITQCPAVVWTRLQGIPKWNLPVNILLTRQMGNNLKMDKSVNSSRGLMVQKMILLCMGRMKRFWNDEYAVFVKMDGLLI